MLTEIDDIDKILQIELAKIPTAKEALELMGKTEELRKQKLYYNFKIEFLKIVKNCIFKQATLGHDFATVILPDNLADSFYKGQYKLKALMSRNKQYRIPFFADIKKEMIKLGYTCTSNATSITVSWGNNNNKNNP